MRVTYWITEQVAVSGGEISPDNWHRLSREKRITAVLNLRSEHQDTFSSPWPVAYLWLPVADFTRPTQEQLRIGVQFIQTAVTAGERVLIHCNMGIGRSPTMAAAYLVWSGTSVKEAIRQIEEAAVGVKSPVFNKEALAELADSLKGDDRKTDSTQ